MFKRIIQPIVKQTKKIIVDDKYTEEKFNALLKKLNINMVTLTMKQKDEIDPKKEPTDRRDRCD
jgi:hypothetical protein